MRILRLLLAPLLALLLVTVAAPVAAQDETSATDPPATEPPATEPPATEPPTTEAPDEDEDTDEDDDDGTDIPWATIVGLIVLGVVVLVVVRVISQASARRRRTTGAWSQRLASANSVARWLHDSFAFELSNPALDQNPEMLRSSWTAGHQRVSGLSAELHGLVPSAPSSSAQQSVLGLISAVEGLSGALATDVSVRTSGDPDDANTQARRAESAQTVALRRAELANAIADADRHIH